MATDAITLHLWIEFHVQCCQHEHNFIHDTSYFILHYNMLSYFNMKSLFNSHEVSLQRNACELADGCVAL